jgi:hypothetical protein
MARPNRFPPTVGAGAALLAACAALAQVECGSAGGDLVFTDFSSIANYTASAGVDAAAFGIKHTNIGSAPLSAVLTSAMHPVLAPNLYRFTDSGGVSRIEQVGMGWCFHSGIPLNTGGFCVCQSAGGVDDVIGVGCTDTHTATRAGTPGSLGPRWQVNASTGVSVFPWSTPTGTNAGRVQFALADVDPAANPGALLFAEMVVVHPDDAAAGNAANNVSVRRVTATVSAGNASILLSGSTQPGAAAVQLWKALDSGVVEAIVDVPGDGRFIVAARAVRLGGNQWDYEYAVFNQNSHRSARAFTLPLPADAGDVTAGFHDVHYHSGDGPGGATIVGTDWVFSPDAGAATWATDTIDANAAANALRWGTMYNFRLRGPVSPETGEVVIDLFRPGAPDGVAAAVPIPARLSCLADHDGNGVAEVADIFAFLADWFAGAPAGDALGDGGNGVPDIFAFLAAWFAGC